MCEEHQQLKAPWRPIIGVVVGELPDFIIAGALRSGTSSLARYLRTHPQIDMAHEKELHFFDVGFAHGLDWYASQFQRRSDGNLTGEATPAYMSDPDALNRMAEAVPHARLIFSLREPIARAQSHYWMRFERDTETRPLDQAFAEELDTYRSAGPDSTELVYVRNSLYDLHLERVLELFSSEQVHVTIFERMIDRPEDEFQSICRFLGIDDGHIPEVVGTQVNQYVRFRSLAVRDWTKHTRFEMLARAAARLNTRTRVSYPEMDGTLRDSLAGLFAPHNNALEELLGQQIPEWRTRSSTPTGQ